MFNMWYTYLLQHLKKKTCRAPIKSVSFFQILVHFFPQSLDFFGFGYTNFTITVRVLDGVYCLFHRKPQVVFAGFFPTDIIAE